MKRESNWLRPWMVGAFSLLILAGVAWATIPSARFASIRLTSASTAGTSGTAANPVVWSDTTTRPNFRFGDGTADQYVPTCTPTTNGDVCSWNGTNWIRAAGSGAAVTTGYSVVDWCNVNGGSTGGANISNGQKVWFTKASTITGIRVWFVGGLGAKTLKLTLWSSAGSSLATVNVSVNAAGVYTGTFGTPYSVTSGLTYTDFYVTMWINDGTAAYSYTANTAAYPSATVQTLASPYYWIKDVSSYATGNASPTTDTPGNFFPVEPVFTVP